MCDTTTHCVDKQAYLNNIRAQLDKRLGLTELNIQILLFTLILLLPLSSQSNIIKSHARNITLKALLLETV